MDRTLVVQTVAYFSLRYMYIMPQWYHDIYSH